MKKTSKLLSLGLSVGLMATAFVPAMPASADAAAVSSDHAPVTVYFDAKYSGASQEFDVGQYDVDVIKAGIGNDEMSSIRVAQGYQVTAYKDAGFSGDSYVFKQDYADFADINFNDLVSSLKVEQINPLDDTCVAVNDLTDAKKAEILTRFAPRIWMAEGETYFPSSVEWALPHLNRVFNTDTNTYWYMTKEDMPKPSTKLDFFSGDMDSAKAYSFWVEKDYNNVDLAYFQYCPYNYGKVVVGTEFGNHVGDWEHITVRLAKFTYEGVDYVKPIQVHFSVHNFDNSYNWDNIDKVDDTHPIGYNAKGSHGMWKDPGNHVYLNIVVSKLTDECSAGTAWDTWTCLETYEYDAINRTGRGVGTSEWKTYFDVDYSNPDSMSVQRWGNKKNGSVFGQDRLGDGPTGPEDKSALSNYVELG